jgi:hypothetical protein
MNGSRDDDCEPIAHGLQPRSVEGWCTAAPAQQQTAVMIDREHNASTSRAALGDFGEPSRAVLPFIAGLAIVRIANNERPRLSACDPRR